MSSELYLSLVILYCQRYIAEYQRKHGFLPTFYEVRDAMAPYEKRYEELCAQERPQSCFKKPTRGVKPRRRG